MDKSARSPAPRRRRRWLLLLLVGLAAGVWFIAFRGPRIEPGTILVLDLEEGLAETSPEGLEQFFSAGVPGVIDLARALEHAAGDSRVAGLLLRVGGGLSPAMAEEVRGLIAGFRKSGKVVLAHADSPDTIGYFLAVSAGEVLLERGGTLDAIGISLGAFFLGDAFAALGVNPDLVRVGDHKGAFEMLSGSAPSPQLEESMKGLADSVYESILLAVAEDRKLDPAAVRNLFDRCPMTAQEAVRAGLADGIASPDDVRARLRELASREVHPLRIEEYLPACRSTPSSGKWIAVVHILGLIADGESREMSFAGRTAGADDIVRALREAAEDPGVVGILLRIDSGGGSASASEKIFAAVESARKRKPLVASLGDTAASGGYYAAAAADKVIAQRTSITGSIGVFGGKLVVERLLGTLKVGRRSWDRGKRAGMYDSTRPFTPDERMAVKDIMEDVYRRFVDRIAASRRKSFEDVNAVAQGRVWTGRAAVDAGLVDSVGGIPEALAALRSLARVPEGTSIGVRRHPEPRGLLDDLLGSGGKRDPFLGTLVKSRPAGPADLRALIESRLFSGRSGFALLPIRIQVR